MSSPMNAGSATSDGTARPSRSRAPAKARKRSRRMSRLILFLQRVALLIVTVAVWELFSGRVISEFWISSPGDVASRLGDWISDGTLASNALVTFTEAGVGFVAGTLVGVLLGFALGLNRWVADITKPYIFALYSLPKMALAPLFLIWFGIGLEMKAVLSAVTVFFLVFYSTYNGVLDADKWLINILRLMGASKWRVVRMSILPGTLPAIFLGIKISLPYALVGAVVGELISSNEGLGYLIQSSASQFDTTGTFAGLVVIGVLAVVLGVIVDYLEKNTLRWKETGMTAAVAG